MNRGHWCIFGMAALLAAPAMQAAIVYDNGGPAAPDEFTDIGSEMTRWIEADNFSLATTDTITGVEFWELDREDLSSYQGSISWFIYADNSGAPGTVLDSGSVVPTRTATGFVYQSVFTEFDTTFSIPAFTATGGTTSWLGLHNGPTTFDTNEQFFWELTNGGSAPANHDFDLTTSGPWNESFLELAFNLSD